MSQLINSIVYENGINATLDNIFALVLFTEEKKVVATSACINNTKLDKPNYLKNRITWNKDEKIVSIMGFGFDETKSVIKDEGGPTATQFALVKLDPEDCDTVPSPAYEGGNNYIWTKFLFDTNISDEKLIFRGALSKPIQVQKDNNFKLDTIEIKFSEIQNA